MSSLTFYLRASSRGKGYPGRLCLRIIHRRRSKCLSSPYRLYPHEWDSLSQQVLPGNRISEEADRYICRIRERFGQINEELSLGGKDTPEDIIRQLCPFEGNRDSLSEFTLTLSRKLSGKGQVRTARAYVSSVNKLLGFVFKRDIRFSGITPSLLKSFEDSLKATGKRPNTISFYMRNLRSVYNKAAEEGVIKKPVVNLFKGVFTGFRKTPKRALDATQMGNIQKLKYSRWLDRREHPDCRAEHKLYTAWRFFTFCFQARGMCFVDMVYLRKDNIREGIIRYYRKKTGGLIEVKLTPLMKQIIDSFSGDVRNTPYLFPVITAPGKNERLQYETGLRTQNRRLKELARQAGIDTKLSTHVSRHSWASIAKNENLPLWVISEGLGHSSEKVTYTYLAQLERYRLDMANETVCAVVCRRAESQSSAKSIYGT